MVELAPTFHEFVSGAEISVTGEFELAGRTVETDPLLNECPTSFTGRVSTSRVGGLRGHSSQAPQMLARSRTSCTMRFLPEAW